VFDKVSD